MKDVARNTGRGHRSGTRSHWAARVRVAPVPGRALGGASDRGWRCFGRSYPGSRPRTAWPWRGRQSSFGTSINLDESVGDQLSRSEMGSPMRDFCLAAV